MAGCFGGSAEDKAMEADLFRFLASQAEDSAIQDVVDDLMLKATDKKFTESLCSDWDFLQQQIGEIANTVAKHALVAERATNRDASHIQYALLGQKMVDIMRKALLTIAKHEADCHA
jgi:hypothetical protein